MGSVHGGKLIKLPARTWPPGSKSRCDLSTPRQGFYWRSIFGWRLPERTSGRNRTTLASDTKWTGRYFCQKLPKRNEIEKWVLWLSFAPRSNGRGKRKTFRFCFPASTLNTKRKPKATYKLAIFTQNCFPSSNKINEAFSMGARGGRESSALAQPNEMVASWWTSWMCALKPALVSFSSKQFSPAGQQKKLSTFRALGRQIGRLSDDALQDRGRRALKLKLPHEVESSDPSVRDIDGHLITAVCFVSGLKLESKLMEFPIDHAWACHGVLCMETWWLGKLFKFLKTVKIFKVFEPI